MLEWRYGRGRRQGRCASYLWRRSTLQGNTSEGTRWVGINSTSNYGMLGNEVSPNQRWRSQWFTFESQQDVRWKLVTKTHGIGGCVGWGVGVGGRSLLRTAAGPCFNHCLAASAIYIPCTLCPHSLWSTRIYWRSISAYALKLILLLTYASNRCFDITHLVNKPLLQ